MKRKKKADAVAEWLRSMGLDKHEASFVDNGYLLNVNILVNAKAIPQKLGIMNHGSLILEPTL